MSLRLSTDLTMLVSILHQIACIRVDWTSPCCSSIWTSTPPSSYPMTPSIRLTECCYMRSIAIFSRLRTSICSVVFGLMVQIEGHDI
ncbi:hypothetical protein EDD22DRAFT_920239, partial [Suillus occidentalis]